MTEDQLQRIEKELNIVLPVEYRGVMLDYPFVLEADCELPNDADYVIEGNRFNGENGFFGIPWPEHYFTFGGDGSGNDYYLDLSHVDSPVYTADHERPAPVTNLEGIIGHMDKLKQTALSGFASLLIILVLLLFVPAGTFDFWQAWLYLFTFASSTMAITGYLLRKSPKLLERRVHGGPTAEKEPFQKIIQSFASVLFCAMFVVAGLDRRLGWSAVPTYLVLVADIFVLLGFFIIFLVFKENSFASSIIEVDVGQKVISTGPYKMVRHPMYAGALLMLLATPVANDSLWALPCSLTLCVVIVVRLLDEERVLLRDLPGYKEYCQMVHYRLIPCIW